MQIANPIYDVVFKYLLEDNRIAKIFLSAIIGEKIETLEFATTETISDLVKDLTVYRLDFKAKIKTPEGTKQVIIEIQKAKLSTDIMRFRKYLAEQYAQNPVDQVGEPLPTYNKAYPIIAIYILGHKLQFTKAPVIKVDRKYIDLSTGETIKEKEDFIESLSHDSYVIQIPYLKGKRKTHLLQLLSIFDQSQVDKNYHLLKIKEEEFPKQYAPVIRRLQKALMDTGMRKKMDLEDEILSVLQENDRKIESMEKMLAEKEKMLAEKEKLINEKDALIAALKKKLKGKNK